MYQFSKKICFGLNLTLVFGALIFGQTDFCRAASDAIEVDPGKTVTLSGWNSTSNLTVGTGGTLIVPAGVALNIENVQGATFNNKGTIRIEGTFDVGTSQGGQDFINPENTGVIEIINTQDKDGIHMPYIPSSFFEKLMDNSGKIVLGGPEATFNSRLSIENVEGADKVIELDASKFATSLGESGNIVLKEYGRFRATHNKLTITGDRLSLGSDAYGTVHSTSQDFDITHSKLSSVYGSDITLTPKSGNTITLDSGFIRVGSGRAPGSDDNERPAQLIISSGDGSLQLAGGALVLGGGGNENAEEGSLNIKGNVIIGTNSDTIDSAMIGRTGKWTMDGDLTLNKSGYLEIGQPYKNGDDETMDLSTLTITEGHQFILNTDLDLNENKFEVLGDMVASSDSEIRVTNGGVINVNNIRMNGGKIVFDPPFIADGDTSNASE